MWYLLLAVVAVVVAAFLVARSRRHRDGVDSFRRQIDALSPEARRPVVDQVQNAAERQSQLDAGSPDDDDADAGDDGDDEDGVRGA